MRIGVWERAPSGDRYERTTGYGPLWARVAGFSRVPDRPRVLLLGESVARGQFYDPLVTPAKLIEQCLRTAAPDGVEVIDLAKLGARVPDLLDIAAAARDLAPSAVVVFAGNNWKYEVTEWAPEELRAAEARALARDGVAGLLRQRESALADAAESVVRRICALYDGVAPVVFALPESNLLDFRPSLLTPVLGGERELTWQRLIRQIRNSARGGDPDGVLEGCAAVHRLDGGVSDEPYRHVGRVHLHRGDVAEALASYRRARDVRLWCDGVDPSWLPSAGVVAARAAAADCRARLVDLTAVLPSHAASGIPDRSLFADFCHLNGRGLLAASAEIACTVAPLLGTGLTPERCTEVLRAPPAQVEAGAALCAAFVNADFGQPEETVAFYARAAATAAPQIVTAMAAYCAAPATAVPWWMRSLKVPAFPNAQNFLRGFGRTGRYLYDDLLVGVFLSEVASAGGGGNGGTAPARRTGGLRPGMRTDVLDPIYAPAWRPVDWEGILGALVGQPARRHYFRAHAERSRFVLPVDQPAVIELDLTVRLGTPGSGAAEVLVNGHDMGRVELSDRWRRVRLRVPSSAVHAGRNHLEIRWVRERLATTPLPILASRLEQGLGQELSVIFGEIYSLHATADTGAAPDG